MGGLDEMEIILDTNAIKYIFDLRNLSQEFWTRFVSWVRNECYTLVVPQILERELRAIHLPLNFIVAFLGELKEKFSEEDARQERMDKVLERRMRQGNADNVDILIVKTAIKRSRITGGNSQIVTNDQAIQNVSGLLRNYNVSVKGVQDFLEYVLRDDVQLKAGLKSVEDDMGVHQEG
jgi:rRNA-processing protein FCF1